MFGCDEMTISQMGKVIFRRRIIEWNPKEESLPIPGFRLEKDRKATENLKVKAVHTPDLN